MSRTLANRSSSGARLLGDHLQYLIGWYWALTLLRPNDIATVEIEADEAGNLDDVVLRNRTEPDVFIQVKASVDAKTPVTLDWLTAPSKNRGPSILRRFFDFWSAHRADQLRLITNKSLDSSDPLLSQRDGYGRLADALRRPKRSKALDGAIETVLAHLDINEATLIEFLDALHLDTDASLSTWGQRVTDCASPHLRCDTGGILSGIAWLQREAERTRPILDRGRMVQAIDELNLQQAAPKATVAIAALGPLATDDALVFHDFRPYFETPGPQLGPDRWAEIGERVATVGQECKDLGATDLDVRATCRLPMWFGIGRSLRDTQGFDVATTAHSQLWATASSRPLEPHNKVTPEILDRGHGDQLSVIVSIVADDPTTEILSCADELGLDGRVVRLRRAEPTMAIDAEQGQAVAQDVRNEIREACRDLRPSHVHLFLVSPAPIAMMLGRLWDRLPATTIYEYLGPGAGYEPALGFDAS